MAAQDIPKSVQDSVPDSGKGKYVNPADGTSTKYIALMQSGNECIGSSIYFFFELGTARLTDVSQLINLDELARVAKKYGLSVAVIGAADSATGTAEKSRVL